MAIGLIIIGDEILSGKRTDKHLSKCIEILAARGLQLAWAEYLGDEPARITASLRRVFAGEDVVFSCGGIGATPDDHTRQCAAAALNLPLALHPKAREKIRQRISETAREAGIEPDYESRENLQRLKMGEFPEGSDIIPNPFNNIPGFAARRGASACYFLPGFPIMAWPMMEWVLDTHHVHLFQQTLRLEKSVLVFEQAEAALTPLMEAIETQFSRVKVFSLPSVGDDGTRRHIELGVKGEPEEVGRAYETLLLGLDQLKAEYRALQS